MAKHRQKVIFKATKMVPKPVSVEFYTKNGERKSFRATQKVPKPVRVEFYAKRKN